MADEAMVSSRARAKIKELIERIASEKGDFYLAMLVQTLPEVPGRWTLVVSAPWADSSSSRPVISYLSSYLSEFLDRHTLSAIDRISVRPSNDPAVRDVVQIVNDFLGVKVSGTKGGYYFRGGVEGLSIPEGFIFAANPDANGRTVRPAQGPRKAARSAREA